MARIVSLFIASPATLPLRGITLPSAAAINRNTAVERDVCWRSTLLAEHLLC